VTRSAPAVNVTRVQTVAMWDLSMYSEWGRVTLALAMLASPGRIRSSARKAGVAPRLALPFRLSRSLGLKGRAAQSAAWKGELAVTGRSSASLTKSLPEPRTVLAVEVDLQLGGLRP